MARASDADAGSAPPSAGQAPETTAHNLRSRVADLARRITSLSEEDEEPVDDVEACQRLALSIKPYVDRLSAVRRLLNPVGRIIERREQIQELQQGLAEDVAFVEGASEGVGDNVDPSLLNELHAELAAVKRDRRIFVDEEDPDPGSADDEMGPPTATGRSRPVPLLDRPVAERLQLLLGHRFIPAERVGDILGGPLPQVEVDAAAERLERVWEGLMGMARFREHARADRIRPLRRAFRDYVIVYRAALIPGLGGGAASPCTIEALKAQQPARFVSAAERNLWYARLPFYRQPLATGHWALLDGQYLNCTFKRPKIRLVMYARANDVPPAAVRQKSVVEDVYDRVVVDGALGVLFFSNCNSVTRTSYQQGGGEAKKVAHVYYRDGQIRISGKRGVPHWRPGKPHWPGVLPAIVFAQEGSAPPTD